MSLSVPPFDRSVRGPTTRFALEPPSRPTLTTIASAVQAPGDRHLAAPRQLPRLEIPQAQIVPSNSPLAVFRSGGCLASWRNQGLSSTPRGVPSLHSGAVRTFGRSVLKLL